MSQKSHYTFLFVFRIIRKYVRSSAIDSLGFVVFKCIIPLPMARQAMLEQRYKIAAWEDVFQSPTAVQRAFENLYGRHSAPTRSTIYAIHSKFLERGSVLHKPLNKRPATITSDENTEPQEQAFVQSQRKSIRGTTLELCINRSMILQMLRKVMKLYPYGLGCSNASGKRLWCSCGNPLPLPKQPSTLGSATSPSFISLVG